NDAVEAAAVRAGLTGATVARLAAAPVVLGMSDTTSLDYSAHPATAGLGHLEQQWRHGVLLHTVLAVTAEGLPVGVLSQQWWARDPAQAGQRATRLQRPTAAKESQKWLNAVAEATAAVPPEALLVLVGDRESDVFDLFA
ncbi:MAG: IS4 family transposase, partial [Fimbriimonadaceae bacterium]|nr:IS4 family transposase [Fimbriimonadaceae bacterium]